MNSGTSDIRLPILHSKPYLGDEESSAAKAVLDSGHLESGSWVRKFEDAVAERTEKKYAVATSNGFGAIHLALSALKIAEKDEVIIPSYTCSALYHPVRLLGAIPVICDIEKNGFNLSIKDIEQKINSKTKAIIIPHTFGFPVDISSFKKFGIPIIEDCAHALGFNAFGNRIGSVGDITICSFYASKLLCAGDGGMVLTDNKDWFSTMNEQVCYSGKKGLSGTAFNYRYTNLNAALGLAQLEKLPEILEKRIRVSRLYDQFFIDSDKINISFSNKEASCFYRYPIAISNRDEVKKELSNQGIYTGFGVLENMHTLVPNMTDTDFPESVKQANEILSIPIYPSLMDSEVEFIANNILKLVEAK